MSFYTTRIRNHNGKPTAKNKRKSVEWFWGYKKKSFLGIIIIIIFLTTELSGRLIELTNLTYGFGII